VSEIPSSTTAYANYKGLYIHFQSLHTPSAKVKFKAFTTSFSQEFTSNWNSQTVFGRMDPIQTFQNTQRTISLTWKTTSVNAEEAAENLRKINLLTRMLYPTYDDAGGLISKDGSATSISNALTIAKPPLMRVRFVNWIQAAPDKGLIVATSGFSYEPDFSEEGAFDYLNNIVPKTITISCTLTVLHEYDLGWSQDGEWLGEIGDNPGTGGTNFPFVTSNAPVNTAPPSTKKPDAAPVSAAAATANQLGSTSGNSVDRVATEAEVAYLRCSIKAGNISDLDASVAADNACDDKFGKS
jgi:hypothetical protein